MNDLLDARYGGTRPGRRRALIAVSALIAVVSLSWLVWVIADQTRPDVQSTLVSFDFPTEREAVAVVEVKTRSKDVIASCQLRAYAKDHTVVGEQNFRIKGIKGLAEQKVTMRTERPGASVELVGCTSPNQSRPR